MPNMSTMSAEGRGVISERMDLMVGRAWRIMTQRRVSMRSFWWMRPVRSGEGMLMTLQREGVRAEFRI